MKLQQLRYVSRGRPAGPQPLRGGRRRCTPRSRACRKQIKELEDELGVEIFVRRGKRLTAVTEPGRAVLEIAERILAGVGEPEARRAPSSPTRSVGTLTIATTHTQARYALPKAVARVQAPLSRRAARAPPGQPDADLRDGDRAARPTSPSPPSRSTHFPELVSLPCYQWNRCVVVPSRHPLAKREAAHARGGRRSTRSSPTTSLSRTAR